jgi:hypothetical protein
MHAGSCNPYYRDSRSAKFWCRRCVPRSALHQLPRPPGGGPPKSTRTIWGSPHELSEATLVLPCPMPAVCGLLAIPACPLDSAGARCSSWARLPCNAWVKCSWRRPAVERHQQHRTPSRRTPRCAGSSLREAERPLATVGSQPKGVGLLRRPNLYHPSCSCLV